MQRDGHAIVDEEALTPRDRAREALLMGLRLTEGVLPARIAARSGLDFVDCVDLAALDGLIAKDLMAWRADGHLAATPAGLLRLDSLLPILVQ